MDNTLTRALSHLLNASCFTCSSALSAVSSKIGRITMKGATTFATAKLLAVAVAMFAFGFALVPLYEIYCQVTGANGKTGDQYQATEQLVIDESREVTVQFLANNNANMPWQFRPSVRTMKVVPGKMYETTFFAGNITRDSMVGQAVPSVAPFHAAEYFHKTECFCFEQQELAGGDQIDMPLRFIVDPQLPETVKTLTLSYTLFDVTEAVRASVAAE